MTWFQDARYGSRTGSHAQFIYMMWWQSARVTQRRECRVPANDYVEITASSSGYQRYLIHLDDPEKEQFPEGINAITLINGFPLDLTRELSKSEKAKIRLELMRIIRENGVTEYCDFVFGLMDMGDPDMLDYACNHTILFNGVISSQRNRYTYGQGKVAGSTEQSATTGAK